MKYNSSYQLDADFGPQRGSYNNPEDERERQILEYRRRLQQEEKPQKERPKASNPPELEKQLRRTYEWMARTFPEIFGPESERKPLKLHILNDLKQFYKHAKVPQPQGLLLRAAMSRYLVMDEYLDTLVEGAPRHNLEGEVCGEVTGEEAFKAQELRKKPFKERL